MKYILNDGNQYDITPESGLPEEVFIEISSIVPIPNVDLFIVNESGRLLLSWRDDPYYGKGWHLPGGCIRFKETMEERIHKTALAEIGCDVSFDESPLAIKDVIVNITRTGLHNQNERAHNVAILFKCKLPHVFETTIPNYTNSSQHEKKGTLRWFDHIPHNILSVHEVYKDIFLKYGLIKNG